MSEPALELSYQAILAQVSSPQLRGMAESCVGRVQLKDGDPAAALATFQNMLGRYPEERDLNRMYPRFLSQYQVAISLEALGRDREALETLLELNRDLLRRSDAINSRRGPLRRVTTWRVHHRAVSPRPATAESGLPCSLAENRPKTMRPARDAKSFGGARWVLSATPEPLRPKSRPFPSFFPRYSDMEVEATYAA